MHLKRVNIYDDIYYLYSMRRKPLIRLLKDRQVWVVGVSDGVAKHLSKRPLEYDNWCFRSLPHPHPSAQASRGFGLPLRFPSPAQDHRQGRGASGSASPVKKLNLPLSATAGTDEEDGGAFTIKSGRSHALCFEVCLKFCLK